MYSFFALYAAKEAGKARVVSFEPSHDKEADEQRQTEQDLLSAIKKEEFFLVYQPQVDTSSETIVGYEALIRWAHPARGEISPTHFIPIAEKLKLMDKIGEFVLDSACQFATTWPATINGNLPTLSVNVSPQQLKNANFFRWWLTLLPAINLIPKGWNLR